MTSREFHGAVAVTTALLMCSRKLVRALVMSTALLGLASCASPEPSPRAAGTPREAAPFNVERASISGQVTSEAGVPLSNALVDVFSGQTQMPDRRAYTNRDGNYRVPGLAADSYAVCVRGDSTSGGGATKYEGRCTGNLTWFPATIYPPGDTDDFEGDGPPAADADRISVQSEERVTGVNFALPAAAAISGRVTSVQGGVAGATVFVFDRSNAHRYVARTGKNGMFLIGALPPVPGGYSVCVDPFESTVPRSGRSTLVGFLPRCYPNRAWSGTAHDPAAQPLLPSSLPLSPTNVAVSRGQIHTGVNIEVPTASAISGTVWDEENSRPAGSELEMVAFVANGAPISAAFTGPSGQYVLPDLPASRPIRVCVYPGESGSRYTTAYNGQCWKGVPYQWGELPARATSVTVRLGRIHGGIDFVVSGWHPGLGPDWRPLSRDPNTERGTRVDPFAGQPERAPER